MAEETKDIDQATLDAYEHFKMPLEARDQFVAFMRATVRYYSEGRPHLNPFFGSHFRTHPPISTKNFDAVVMGYAQADPPLLGANGQMSYDTFLSGLTLRSQIVLARLGLDSDYKLLEAVGMNDRDSVRDLIQTTRSGKSSEPAAGTVTAIDILSKLYFIKRLAAIHPFERSPTRNGLFRERADYDRYLNANAFTPAMIQTLTPRAVSALLAGMTTINLYLLKRPDDERGYPGTKRRQEMERSLIAGGFTPEAIELLSFAAVQALGDDILVRQALRVAGGQEYDPPKPKVRVTAYTPA